MLKSIRRSLIMLKENVTMSMENIRGNKSRSFLTILGILIGVAAVIALISTVSGVTNTLSSSFASLGAGTLSVSVTGNDLKPGLASEDLITVTETEGVTGVVPNVSMRTSVVYGGERETRISVSGKNAYYFRLNPDMVKRGRPITVVDEDNNTFVCLISASMVETFFFGIDPIGETMYVGGLPFLVVGLIEEDSGGGVMNMISGSPDILIPYTTALKMNNSNVVTSFTVYMEDLNPLS